MKIYIGTDHAGYELKETLITFLEEEFPELEIVDEGAFSYDSDDDYPDYIKKVAQKVADTDGAGIILGGSGQGEAMAANRYSGVRAAVYYGGSEEIVKLSREHNDANILSLGAQFLTEEEATQAVRLWMTTDFSGDDRHQRRINKLDA